MLHNQTSYSKRSFSLWERIVNGMDFTPMFSLVLLVCLVTPAAAQTTPSFRLTPLRTAQTQTTPSFRQIPLRAGQTTPSFPQTPPSATQITPSSAGQTTPSAGPATQSTTPSSACGNTSYYGPSGFIRSPNYPGTYYNNLDCNYSIYGSNESSLWLVFESFGTESCCDIVTISCPGDPSFPIQRFSGSSLPDPVWISRCSLGLVNFRTDGSRVAPGFSLSYNVTVEAATVCGDTSYYGSSGVISSPNYPGNYYNDLNCSYYIYAATGNSLTITFKSFDVEEGYDSVTISCATNSSFSPQRYTGNSLPEAVSVPWCSRGLVNFRTDNSTVSGGFSLNYYVSVGGCGNTVYTGSNGYVTSTNYPSNYGFYQNCSSIIWAPQRSTFYLSFESLFLYGCCNCDWLEISCLDNSDYGPYRFCGQYIGMPNLYVYGCSQVLLWFHSDGSVSQGFKTQYTIYAESESTTTAVPPGFTTTTNYPPTSTLEPACHYDYIHESSGVITSPNYPGNYYNSLSCYYYIYATVGSTIAFIFEDFHVQDSADYIRIDCPPNSNFPVQQYSGQAIPPPLSIMSCSRANLYFYTDSSIVYSGFNIKYYVSDGDCGHTVHNESFGQVTSPNYPSNYSYYQNCSHIIWAPQRSHFHLNFLFFELQDCATCGGDWVEISCLDNNPSNKRRFCGSTAYSLDYYQCTQVFVWFHSDGPYNDGTSNYKGFNLEYNVYPELETTSVQDAMGSSQTTSTQSLPASTLEPGCDEFHCGPSGTITSPNYPDNYHDSLRCNYIIQGSTDSFITIIFDHFDMQDDKDYVTIRCETNSSFPEQTYSGHTLPPPLTIPWCSQASVYFNSDKDTVYSGFSIDYYVNDEGCGHTVYTGSVGNVTSPNYPAYYSYYENCSNIIWAPQRSHFHLSFQSVATQSLCELCSCDFIEISCRDNNPSYKHRLCDEANRIFDFYQCTQVLVWFHSDDTSNDPFDLGFLLNYNVYPDAGCGETVYTGVQGYVASPNYPNNYGDNQNCSNIIWAYKPTSFDISFLYINLEECCDFVELSCVDNPSYGNHRFTGDSLPTTQTIPQCTQVLVWFFTDDSNVFGGFNLGYSVTPGSETDD